MNYFFFKLWTDCHLQYFQGNPQEDHYEMTFCFHLHLTAFPLRWLCSFDCKYRLHSVPGRTTVMHSKISLAVFVKRFLVRSLVTWTTLAWSFKMTSQRTSVLLSHHQQTTNCLDQTRGPKTRTRLRMKVKYSRYIKQRLIWRWRGTGPAGREVVILRHSRSTVRARQENTRHNSSVKFKMADMFTTPEWSLSGLMRTLEEGRNRQWQLTEEEKTVPLSWSKQRLQVQVLQNLTERLSGFIFPPLQFQWNWIKLLFSLFLHPGVTRQ